MLSAYLLAAAVGAAAPADIPCAGVARPAIRVAVTGLSNREGTLRVRVFGGAPSTYFDKRHATVRLERAVPQQGPVRVCVPVPRAGTYALDVRHDFNRNGKTDLSDGGGASGNPKVGMLDVVFGRKPDPKIVQFAVGAGVTEVPVTLRYFRSSR